MTSTWRKKLDWLVTYLFRFNPFIVFVIETYIIVNSPTYFKAVQRQCLQNKDHTKEIIKNTQVTNTSWDSIIAWLNPV